jgi:hypothetical protein
MQEVRGGKNEGRRMVRGRSGGAEKKEVRGRARCEEEGRRRGGKNEGRRKKEGGREVGGKEGGVPPWNRADHDKRKEKKRIRTVIDPI